MILFLNWHMQFNQDGKNQKMTPLGGAQTTLPKISQIIMKFKYLADIACTKMPMKYF